MRLFAVLIATATVLAGCSRFRHSSAGRARATKSGATTAVPPNSHPAALIGKWRLLDFVIANATSDEEKRRHNLLDKGTTFFTFQKDGTAVSVTGSQPPGRGIWTADATRLEIDQPVAAADTSGKAGKRVFHYRLENHNRGLHLSSPNGKADLVFRKE